MSLIKPELERVYGGKDNQKIYTRLIEENYTGFVILTYYQNGIIMNEKEWQNGRPYGYQIEYYDNGQLNYYDQLDDYNDIGPSKAFWPDGSVKFEEIETESGWVERQYDQVGNITFESGKNGTFGEWIDYTL
ncbi:MAG: hypothetical protein HRT68_00520 [Flavobacteriaceae bacterium]|nr:hypothetical protein [Flavobacteriaceae bacterium]